MAIRWGNKRFGEAREDGWNKTLMMLSRASSHMEGVREVPAGSTIQEDKCGSAQVPRVRTRHLLVPLSAEPRRTDPHIPWARSHPLTPQPAIKVVVSGDGFHKPACRK